MAAADAAAGSVGARRGNLADRVPVPYRTMPEIPLVELRLHRPRLPGGFRPPALAVPEELPETRQAVLGRVLRADIADIVVVAVAAVEGILR